MSRRLWVETLTALLVRGLVRDGEIPEKPERIFVLRNNDIGDLLVVTPLFEALKRKFPEADVCAGVGAWNVSVLKNNPWVDRVLVLNAPWHNQVTGKGSNSLGGFWRSLCYVFGSGEMQALRRYQAQVGLDVLGSPEGALLLARAGIPCRMGMRGYAYDGGTYSRSVPYDGDEQVGRMALRLGEVLGITDFPEIRPQIFLSQDERAQAEARWGKREGRRIVLAPGGGYAAKRWPKECFQALANMIPRTDPFVVVGGAAERELGAFVAGSGRNLCGELSLRESMAMVATADAVVCNSSMFMHVAAAFRKPCVTVLGEIYSDAAQHQRQWGYPEPSIVLGKQSPEEALPSVESVARALRERLDL